MGRKLPPNDLFRAARERLPSPSGAPGPISRQELADAVNAYLHREHRVDEKLNQDDIGRIERGRTRWPGKWRRVGLRAVLGVASDAELGFYFHRTIPLRLHADQAVPDDARRRIAALAPASLSSNRIGTTGQVGTAPGQVPQRRHPPGTAAALTPRATDQQAPFDPQVLRDGGTGSVLTLTVTGGRVFDGSMINARVYPAIDDGRIVTTIPASEQDNWMPGWPGRELVVGSVERDTRVDAFGIDSRRAGQQLAAAEGRLLIPQAYRLDDLTVGLLWAVANLDTSLLRDDAQLAACHTWISQYEALPCSSASREAVAALSPVSQMWLGSEFCARHILRHCDTLAGLPAFWTREQYGGPRGRAHRDHR